MRGVTRRLRGNKLVLAAKNGDLKKVQKYLEKGANIHHKDKVRCLFNFKIFPISSFPAVWCVTVLCGPITASIRRFIDHGKAAGFLSNTRLKDFCWICISTVFRSTKDWSELLLLLLIKDSMMQSSVESCGFHRIRLTFDFRMVAQASLLLPPVVI